MKHSNDEMKIGAGHASAMARLGMKELRAAFYPESNVAQPSEYGLYGTRTPGEVAESRKETTLDLEEEKSSVLDGHIAKAESRAQERDSKDLERE